VKRSSLVEIGRLVEINYGPEAGKVATVIDIVDGARALIDGPVHVTGVRRQTIPLRNLSLTQITVPTTRGVRPGLLAKHLKKGNTLALWNKTNWARKLQRHKVRENLTDFERFQLMVLRRKRASIVNKEFNKLKKEHYAAKTKAAKGKGKAK